MNADKLKPTVRMVVRLVALGLSDEDICVELPGYEAGQIAKLRTGATFKKALAEMQAQIDERIVEQAGEDPVRAYLSGKGMSMAKTIVSLAENTVDGEDDVPHAVRLKAADSVLAKAGYNAVKDVQAVPVLMLSPEKMAAVLERPNVLSDVPDCVDGHV